VAWPSSPARALEHVLRGVVLAVLLVGLFLPNVSVAVNAALSLVVTLLPPYLRRRHDVHLGPGLTVWIAATVALHSLGMLALYEAIFWWDHLTHVSSGTLIAGVGYAAVEALDRHTERIHLPTAFLGFYVVVFTLAAGVLWELFEMGGREVARALGREPILVVYGVDDTVLDLVFDGLGGLVVALGGAAYFEDTRAAILARLERGAT
jgi:hypothetical protein